MQLMRMANLQSTSSRMVSSMVVVGPKASGYSLLCASFFGNPFFAAIRDHDLVTFETLIDHGLSVDSIDERRHNRAVNYSLTKSRKVYALLCTADSLHRSDPVLS